MLHLWLSFSCSAEALLHLPAGILFTKIDLDDFDAVHGATLSRLDDLLSRSAVLKGPAGHGSSSSDVVMLQVATMAAYAAHAAIELGNATPGLVLSWIGEVSLLAIMFKRHRN